MYRAIIEVTVKLVVDIDTDMYEESDGYGEPNSMDDRIDVGLDEFYENTKCTFNSTTNCKVVEKYTELTNIERI